MTCRDFPPLRYGRLHDLAGHLLRHASLRGQAAFGHAFAGEGITPLHYMIAELLAANGPTGHKDVSAAMGTQPSVITTTLKPMLADGRIARRGGIGDRRAVLYELTAVGRTWFDGVRPRIEAAEAVLLGRLADEEAEQLRRLLRKLLQTPGSDV